jgi:hypothetical protein
MMFKLVNEVKKYSGVFSLSEDYILIKFYLQINMKDPLIPDFIRI